MPSSQGAPILKYVAHSKTAVEVAQRYGWHPGARYTNLRDTRSAGYVGFLDIDWKRYCFKTHLSAAKATRPHLTVARDITDIAALDRVLNEAQELARWCSHVIVVPKDERLAGHLNDLVPSAFLLGYSVPTRYGGTAISPHFFRRPVHLLGGRPDRQRQLAAQMPVVSMDCNRFTLDAAYGDYFDGSRFAKHPVGGYLRCLEDSVRGINMLWEDYTAPNTIDVWQTLKEVA